MEINLPDFKIGSYLEPMQIGLAETEIFESENLLKQKSVDKAVKNFRILSKSKVRFRDEPMTRSYLILKNNFDSNTRQSIHSNLQDIIRICENDCVLKDTNSVMERLKNELKDINIEIEEENHKQYNKRSICFLKIPKLKIVEMGIGLDYTEAKFNGISNIAKSLRILLI